MSENGNTATLTCRIPHGPEFKLRPEDAMVLELRRLREITGKFVTSADLAEHAFCRKHALQAREKDQTLAFFPYLATVKQLRRREAEQEKTGNYLSQYLTRALVVDDRSDKRDWHREKKKDRKDRYPRHP